MRHPLVVEPDEVLATLHRSLTRQPMQSTIPRSRRLILGDHVVPQIAGCGDVDATDAWVFVAMYHAVRDVSWLSLNFRLRN